MHRKPSGQLRPDHENLDLNQDLRYINLPPEEIPKRGQLPKYLDIYKKIRTLGEGQAFYVPIKPGSPHNLKHNIKRGILTYGLPLCRVRYRAGRLYIYRPKPTAAPAATSSEPSSTESSSS